MYMVTVLIVTLVSFRSHDVALTKGLLEGYKIHVTKKVKPEPSQMKGMEKLSIQLGLEKSLPVVPDK